LRRQGRAIISGELGWFFGHWKLDLPVWAILSLFLYSFITNPEIALWHGIGARNAAIVVAAVLPPAIQDTDAERDRGILRPEPGRDLGKRGVRNASQGSDKGGRRNRPGRYATQGLEAEAQRRVDYRDSNHTTQNGTSYNVGMVARGRCSDPRSNLSNSRRRVSPRRTRTKARYALTERVILCPLHSAEQVAPPPGCWPRASLLRGFAIAINPSVPSCEISRD